MNVANKTIALIAAVVAALFGSSSNSRAAQRKPEDRVLAFIADYERVHDEVVRRARDVDFDQWKAAVDKLDRAHFVDGAGRALGDVIQHGSPPHGVDAENIISTRAEAGVYVETRTEFYNLARYYEYEMRDVGGDWRIARIREYSRPADAPFVAEADRARFENPPIQPLRAMPQEEASFDGAVVFAHGRDVRSGDEVGAIEVKTVGMLNVTTGVLVVGDLGYDARTLYPVGRRVAPGRYRAEVAVAFDRILALRIVLSDKPVAKWHPADMDEGGHGVGVDSASVSISDASGILAVGARHKDRQFELFADHPMRGYAGMLTLANPDDTVISESGNGDGAYPVFWGVDVEGELAVLLVAFIDLPSAEG